MKINYILILTFFSSLAFSQENSIKRADRVMELYCTSSSDYNLCRLELSLAFSSAYMEGIKDAGCRLKPELLPSSECETLSQFSDYLIYEIENYGVKVQQPQ